MLIAQLTGDILRPPLEQPSPPPMARIPILGPPVCGGGMLKRIILISVPVSELRITGAGCSGTHPASAQVAELITRTAR